MFILKLFTAISCGLIAGVFFAFSSFVMSALARLQPPQGTAAMQAINIAVINPWFMGVFLGTAGACLFLLGFSLIKWQHPDAVWLLIGSLLYLVGTFGVTLAFNVPLNEALARVEPSSTEGQALWADYRVIWTLWNHVRTVAALGGATSFTCALWHRVL